MPGEETIHLILVLIMIIVSVPTFLYLCFGGEAPYGRYRSAQALYSYFPVEARLAWFIQESPALVIPLICLSLGREELLSNPVNIALCSLFLLHYAQRTLIFPFLLRGGKKTPLFIVFLAFMFCLWNGYIQFRYLTVFEVVFIHISSRFLTNELRITTKHG
eukprot:TRINITY_DN611_c0_g1_i2.p1 TRINITY_DN611_c0_g1~~TRINITY_DN611_c0_g1_i2.p1  ORF type:complete len:161 (+),score=6.91 TRINITY_DN611_c0_g1_i2:63-545(+)